MVEYIERNALIEHIKNDPLYDLVEQYGITGVIESFPAADVQPMKHGKWLTTDAFPHHVYCSECHMTYIPNDKWQVWLNQYGDGGLPRDFCPNCGARMDGDKNG